MLTVKKKGFTKKIFEKNILTKKFTKNLQKKHLKKKKNLGVFLVNFKKKYIYIHAGKIVLQLKVGGTFQKCI